MAVTQSQNIADRGADARAILAWALNPTCPPFTPELEQAACRCAAAIIRQIKSDGESKPSMPTESASR